MAESGTGTPNPSGIKSEMEVQAPQHNFLPTSAPVSSLLPPLPNHPSTSGSMMSGGAVPTFATTAHNNSNIHAQLATFLAQAATPQTIPMHPALAAAAATTNAAALLNPLAATSRPSHHATANMQNWSVQQLEQQVALLKRLNQPVPQNIAMLLNDAKKRAEKRQAKRIANRKSACTSRARKKALVKEMTELNTRLRRQALILSLLPDLVIVTDVEGKITFCSAQVERVLQHDIEGLIGAKLTEIVAPESRVKLDTFVQELLADSSCVSQKHKKPRRSNNKATKTNKSAAVSGSATETTFPLSVVKLDQKYATGSDENEHSDTSASNDKQPSSLTNSSLGNSGSDDMSPKKAAAKKTEKKEQPSSDSSNTSITVSSDSKNLLNANANLERNVRWHNEKMKGKKPNYKDDVTGAAVTANNATARLSSLQHHASCMSSSEEEDSGYRESNDSREETSSSEEGENLSAESNGQRKPIAPTCNICLVRSDLTTVWCEVTSSVRTRNDSGDMVVDDSKSVGNRSPPPPAAAKSETTEEGALEILLCLRPIRDGEERLDDKHKFAPNKNEKRLVSEDSGNSGVSSEEAQNYPKRPLESSETGSAKRPRMEGLIDTAVVESLLSMNQK